MLVWYGFSLEMALYPTKEFLLSDKAPFLGSLLYWHTKNSTLMLAKTLGH